MFEILRKAIDEKFQFEHDELILTKDSINNFVNCISNELKNINNNGVSDEDFIKSKIENLVNKYPNIAAKIWTSFQEDGRIEYNIYIFTEEIYKDVNYCKDETSIKDEFKQKYDSYVNFLSCKTYDENVFTKYKSYILKLKGKNFQNKS